MNKILLIIALMALGCSTGRYAGKYQVSIRQDNKTKIEYVETKEAVERLLNNNGLTVVVDEYMGTEKPYFEIKNDRMFVYVEKK